MEVDLQTNVPRKKPKQKVPNLKKNPVLKQHSAIVENKNIDCEERNVGDSNKDKSNVKSNHFPSPIFLEAFANYNLNGDFNDDSKIEYSELPHCADSLDLQSARRRNPKTKTTKSNTTNIIKQKSFMKHNDDERVCINWRLVDDVDELLALKPIPEGSFRERNIKPKIIKTFQEDTDVEKYHEEDLRSENFDVIRNWLAQIDMTEESFGGDIKSIQNRTRDEVISNYQEIPSPSNLISESDPGIEMINQYYQPGKKSRVYNPQEMFQAKVPKPGNILENVCTNCKFLSLNAPRNKKPLAVVDLDIVIHYFEPVQTSIEKPTSRLFLHKFLSTLYKHYDLAIWVKTPMTMLLAKLNSLEIITKKHSYKICFCLDNSSVVNSYIPRLGNPTVKPLEVIWNFYTQYNKRNIILIGDQRHQFYFNTKFTLQIKKVNRITFIKDPDLLKLAEYMVNIAKSCKDFSKIGVRITNAYFMTIREQE